MLWDGLWTEKEMVPGIFFLKSATERVSHHTRGSLALPITHGIDIVIAGYEQRRRRKCVDQGIIFLIYSPSIHNCVRREIIERSNNNGNPQPKELGGVAPVVTPR